MEENKPEQSKPRALVTGASGMLGAYVAGVLADGFTVDSLGRDKANDICCDLTECPPTLCHKSYQLVVHCAGSEKDEDSLLNTQGTDNLLTTLSTNPPKYLVFVSSHSVYGDEGENISEDALLYPATAAAKSKEKAERAVARWAQTYGVTLTIIRPARMFGTGVGGETLRLFNDALNGSLIHIRGNNAQTSIVTALDVARVIAGVYKSGGIYNVADGRNPRFIDMAQAMTANAGREKRITTLPSSWAGWLWRMCRWIPAIDRNLRPEVAAKRMKTLTIDGSKAAADTGIEYYDTIEVIARRDTNYPYNEK